MADEPKSRRTLVGAIMAHLVPQKADSPTTEEAAASQPTDATTPTPVADAAAPDTSQEPVAAEPAAENPLLAALSEANITTPEQLTALVQQAELGRGFDKDLRETIGKMAVIALGSEEGAKAQEVLGTLPIEQVKAMGVQYQAIAVRRGFLSDNGDAPARQSVPSFQEGAASKTGTPQRVDSADNRELVAAQGAELYRKQMYGL